MISFVDYRDEIVDNKVPKRYHADLSKFFMTARNSILGFLRFAV